jgi:hypothetical protein
MASITQHRQGGDQSFQQRHLIQVAKVDGSNPASRISCSVEEDREGGVESLGNGAVS